VKIKRGSTSVRRLIFIADSASTTGAGLANLVFNTASLVGYYFAGDLSNEVQITLATATLGTFASGGFIAVDNTNMPGWYEIGIPDAALDGGNECAIQFRGATNMVPVNIYIELDAFDYQTATQPVNTTQFAGTNITAAAGIPEVKVASIAANAVNASSLATDAVTEIQSGLATQASVDDLPTNAELATALGTADDAVLAAIATVQSDTNDIQTRLPAALDGGRIAAVLDSAATAALVDLIWDEPLTKATHNVATSSGKRLRQTNAFQQIDSTVIDASATTTTFATDLDSAVDNFYNDSMLVFTDGALVGQVRSIVDYVGATKTIVLEEPLTSAPVNGVAFTIVSLHIHPVSQIQSGLATSAALAAAKTILDKVDTGLVVDGAVYQFTANMLELAPAGGGGGGSGDATLAKQEEILTQLDVIQTKTDTIGSVGAITSLLAAAVLEPGTITSFPETLTIGDSYTEQNGREIQIPIVDTDGTPLSSTGSLNFADASVTFTLQRSGETDSTRVITGTATFVDPPGTGTGAGAPYAVIELPASETAKGLKKYKYSGILTFLWTGTGTDVMSFETDTVTFDS
jgi:hypothetical protein